MDFDRGFLYKGPDGDELEDLCRRHKAGDRFVEQLKDFDPGDHEFAGDGLSRKKQQQASAHQAPKKEFYRCLQKELLDHLRFKEPNMSLYNMPDGLTRADKISATTRRYNGNDRPRFRPRKKVAQH
jgi:hypothetical protein